MRKESGYQVTDRIQICITGDGSGPLLSGYSEMIAHETLGVLISEIETPDLSKTETIDTDLILTLSIQKQ
jgi:hypothetical protein